MVVALPPSTAVVMKVLVVLLSEGLDVVVGDGSEVVVVEEEEDVKSVEVEVGLGEVVRLVRALD